MKTPIINTGYDWPKKIQFMETAIPLDEARVINFLGNKDLSSQKIKGQYEK